MAYDSKWQDSTFIGMDLETTGKYPLGAEICEMAAVKWRDGKIVDKYQTLIKPTQPMNDEVIAIHHITNEMVEKAPVIADKIKEFYDFISDGYIVAHHAPFDLGFLSVEFEKANLELPKLPVFCSGMLSRKFIPESENHKLQTLIQKLGIEGGQAHRAYDDAYACLQVALICFERAGDSSISELIEHQGQQLDWDIFSMQVLWRSEVYRPLIEAIRKNKPVDIVYKGGSKPGKARTVFPEGIVRRSVVDDFMVAKSSMVDQHPKRYFLSKIASSESH